ncbi:MAG: segregation/condensation protein A, partial [Myxococcota bacterium]
MPQGLASPSPAVVHPPSVGQDDGQKPPAEGAEGKGPPPPESEEGTALGGEEASAPPAEETPPEAPSPAEEAAVGGEPSPRGEDKGAGEGEVIDEKARRRAEVESFLGPSVRTPVGLPDGYIPNDRSIHPIFHVDLSALEFAGPLDLLLYLIRRHHLDILDIPIAFVTEKYLEMLKSLEALEIDVAAEFLVLAAELTHIKSKMLLPADEGVGVEDPPEEVEAGDPRAELIRRLLEYQKYRDAAGQLADRDQLGRDVFPRRPPTLEPVDDLDPGLKQVSVFRLVELMARLLREAPVHHEISYESFSIGERIQFVSAFGEANEGRFTVVSLMERIQSRGELVVNGSLPQETSHQLHEPEDADLLQSRVEIVHRL